MDRMDWVKQQRGEGILKFKGRFMAVVRGLERFKRKYDEEDLAFEFGRKLLNWDQLSRRITPLWM